MAETASPPRPEAGKKPTDDEHIRIVLTSLDKSAEAFGREAAHEERSKNPEGPAWKRVVKSAWNNLTHEYQVVKGTQQKTEELYENANLLHHHGGDDTAWREATQERYASDYAEEMLRDGETFHKLHELDTENANRIQEDVIALVANRAKGAIPDEASFNAALERMCKEWNDQGISQEYIGEGRMLGHNMDKMAMQVKAMVDAISGLDDVQKQTKIDEILANADVVLGEAKAGPEAEIEQTSAERVANKLKNVPFLNEGRFAKVASFVTNETVVAATISVATYGASRAASMIATGVGGGTVAALRERRALRAERVLAERRLAMGGERTEMPDFSDENLAKKTLRKVAGIGVTEEQRRAELEATLLNTVSCDEVIGDIGKFYSPEGDLLVTNADQLKEALDMYGRYKARADRKLLSAGDVELNEQGTRMFEAQKAIAKLKSDIKKLYGDELARSVLDVGEDQFDAHLKEALSNEEGLINQETLEADKLMKKLMRTRVAQRGVFGAALGYAVGEFVQGMEHSVVGGGSVGSLDNTSDHAPSSVNGGAHAPGAVNGGGSHAPGSVNGGGSHAPGSVDGAESHAPGSVDGGNSSHAPENVDGSGSHAPGSVDGESHTPGSVNGSETHAPGSVDGNGGSHAPESVNGGGEHSTAPSEVDGGAGGNTEDLSDHSKISMPGGYKAEVADGHMSITTPDGKTINNLELNKDGSLTAKAQETLRAGGFKISDNVNIVKGNPEVSHVSVSPNEFVQNHKGDMTTIGHREWIKSPDEFKLVNHVNADGSVTIDVSGMQGSSWQAAAANGHMNVYVGASSGSSGHAMKIPIGPDGKATVSANSPARALFDAQGRPSGYEEVAITGDNVNGADHIAVLATAEGTNKDTLTDTITSQKPYATHTYTLSESGTNVNADNMAFATALGETGAAAPIYTMTSRKGIGQTPGAVARAAGAATASSAGATPPPPPPPPGAGPTSGPGGPEAAAAGAAGGAGATGGPEASTGTGGPEATPDPDGFTAGERATMNALDAEALNMEDAFKFAGYESYGEREQKMAMQLIGIARADMGDTTDPADLARRAREMAEAYEAGATPKMAEFYAKVTDFLNEAAATMEAAAEEARKAQEEQTFFDTLDAEGLSTPSGYDFPGSETRGERERKQANRFLREAMGAVDRTDRLAVVAEAMNRVAAALADPDIRANTRDLYQQSLDILAAMQTQLTKEAADAARAKEEEEARRKAEAETPEGREKQFLKDLDAEGLDTPSGYSFKGWSSVDLRQRKMASRFIKQASAAVGARNRIAVVEQARSLAADALAAAETDTVRALLAETMKVLDRTHDFVSSSEKTEVIDEMLTDLNAETDSFPFPSRIPASADDRVNKLVARIFRRVSGGQPFEAPSIGDYNAGYTERETADTDKLRVQYNKKLSKLVRNALVILHTDKLATLDDEMRGVAEEARSIFDRLQNEYRIKRENSFGEAEKQQQRERRRERDAEDARRRAAGGR